MGAGTGNFTPRNSRHFPSSTGPRTMAEFPCAWVRNRFSRRICPHLRAFPLENFRQFIEKPREFIDIYRIVFGNLPKSSCPAERTSLETAETISADFEARKMRHRERGRDLYRRLILGKRVAGVAQSPKEGNAVPRANGRS